jgi:hypothetical protein
LRYAPTVVSDLMVLRSNEMEAPSESVPLRNCMKPAASASENRRNGIPIDAEKVSSSFSAVAICLTLFSERRGISRVTNADGS